MRLLSPPELFLYALLVVSIEAGECHFYSFRSGVDVPLTDEDIGVSHELADGVGLCTGFTQASTKCMAAIVNPKAKLKFIDRTVVLCIDGVDGIALLSSREKTNPI